MSKRTTRPQSPDSSPLLSETADPERGRARGAFLDDAKAWEATPPPATARRGQGSRAFRTVMLVLIAILALLLLGVRRGPQHQMLQYLCIQRTVARLAAEWSTKKQGVASSVSTWHKGNRCQLAHHALQFVLPLPLWCGIQSHMFLKHQHLSCRWKGAPAAIRGSSATCSSPYVVRTCRPRTCRAPVPSGASWAPWGCRCIPMTPTPVTP